MEAKTLSKKTQNILVKAGSLVRAISPANLLMFGGGLVLIVFAVKAAKGMVSPVHDPIDDAIKNTGQSLSYADAYYTVLANTIEQATDNAGTNTQAVYDVFQKLNNDADLYRLIQAYGTRWNPFFGIPTGTYTLEQILLAELSQGELTELNNILSSKGITIKF